MLRGRTVFGLPLRLVVASTDAWLEGRCLSQPCISKGHPIPLPAQMGLV